MKESEKEHTSNVNKLERIVTDLKQIKQERPVDAFAKTASFKMDSMSNYREPEDLKSIIDKNYKSQIDYYRKQCENKQMSHTD